MVRAESSRKFLYPRVLSLTLFAPTRARRRGGWRVAVSPASSPIETIKRPSRSYNCPRDYGASLDPRSISIDRSFVSNRDIKRAEWKRWIRSKRNFLPFYLKKLFVLDCCIEIHLFLKWFLKWWFHRKNSSILIIFRDTSNRSREAISSLDSFW